MAVDLRLYALIDPDHAGEHDLVGLARQVAAGGATLVQLRDKRSGTRAMIEEAHALKAALTAFKVPLVINDRLDVALAAEADGVHLGPDDLSPKDARHLLGPSAIIGLSVKTVADAGTAPVECIDYAGIGGVFATSSKEQKSAPIGPEGLARVATALRRRAPQLPLCGISGIDAGNSAAVIAAGADGVAVISALAKASDPEAAARALREIVDGMLAKRGT